MYLVRTGLPFLLLRLPRFFRILGTCLLSLLFFGIRFLSSATFFTDHSTLTGPACTPTEPSEALPSPEQTWSASPTSTPTRHQSKGLTSNSQVTLTTTSTPSTPPKCSTCLSSTCTWTASTQCGTSFGECGSGLFSFSQVFGGIFQKCLSYVWTWRFQLWHSCCKWIRRRSMMLRLCDCKIRK